MKKRLQQVGFTAIEAVVALLILALLVGVGIWVMNRNANDSKDTTETSEMQQNTEAPSVEAVDDLDAAEQALDASDPDAGSPDNQAIQEELNSF